MKYEYIDEISESKTIFKTKDDLIDHLVYNILGDSNWKKIKNIGV